MKSPQYSEASACRPAAAHVATIGFVIRPIQALERGESSFMRSLFARSIKGFKKIFGKQPTNAPRASFRRVSGALVAFVLFLAATAAAQSNPVSNAEIQGRQLAQQICDAPPAESLTNTGVLQIRDVNGKRTNILVTFSVHKYPDNWTSSYVCSLANFWQESLLVEHRKSEPNQYFHTASNGESNTGLQNDYVSFFANSDFWLGDLGLEFFHWPVQKVLPNPTPVKRGRAYTLLESTNPNPSTNGYSRVLSWIDKESGGILEAEAYDAQGKLLKVFEPKSFKKVNGQWELQEMEIRNVQTSSRTRLEFDLKK